MSATATTQSRQRTFFGHPWGLSTLFLTETWERFSYYGMRAILLYYMYYGVSSGGLGIDSSTAKSLVSVYGASIYLSSILGGWVSDRILGSRRSITWGCVLIMGAHVVLALPSFPGQAERAGLFASMILLVAGTGLLKPNITKAVGDLYSEQDARRDAGFTLFVMGVQIGSFVSPFVVGLLTNADPTSHDSTHNHFHVGFAAAAIGMAIGLAQYLLRTGTLTSVKAAPPNPLDPKTRDRVFATIGAVTAGLAVVLAALSRTGYLTAELVINAISVLSVVLPLGYFVVMLRSNKTTAVEHSRVQAFIPLFVAMVVFWFIEEQQANVFAQYADQQVDLNGWGFHFDPEWSQSINPITMLVFAPLVAAVWLKLGRNQPNTPKKFAIGLGLTGVGFAMPLIPWAMNGPNAKVNLVWLILSLGLISVGELLVNPVSLAVTTALAPAAFASQTVGLNYASDAAAQGLIAQASQLYSVQNAGLYFGLSGALVLSCAALLWMFSPAIHRKMAGVR